MGTTAQRDRNSLVTLSRASAAVEPSKHISILQGLQQRSMEITSVEQRQRADHTIDRGAVSVRTVQAGILAAAGFGNGTSTTDIDTQPISP